MERAALLEYLKKQVSPARLEHSLRVETTALGWAEKFGVAREAVSQAALLHDLCRDQERDWLLQQAAKFAIVRDDIERAEPLLLHGAVAAALVRTELALTDPEILEAISSHITGGPGIGPLARLIFCADSIEPGRSFAAAIELRKQAAQLTPDQLLLAVYNTTIAYLQQAGYPIHPGPLPGGMNCY